MCEVVGITPIECVEQSEIFNFPLGTILYLVEFGGGTNALVPESCLKNLS